MENDSKLIIKATDRIEGSIFERVSESIEAKTPPEETFKMECKAVSELEQKMIDSLGTIYNCDTGYIVVALKCLAAVLESKKENNILREIVKRKQITHLERALEIITIQGAGK